MLPLHERLSGAEPDEERGGCGGAGVHEDLTNGQLARMEPLLPSDIESGRPPDRMRRQLIGGMRWRTRTNAPWRDVPGRYGPWDRGRGLFRCRQRDGARDRITARLQVVDQQNPSGSRASGLAGALSLSARARRRRRQWPECPSRTDGPR
ncbi:transposase [Streptomyces sp. NPDC006435]|uniref:transposase n=1 Tax=Streptomyces sp. NPDC006435 TaxID=3154300 RepID=UPI0033A7B954